MISKIIEAINEDIDILLECLATQRNISVTGGLDRHFDESMRRNKKYFIEQTEKNILEMLEFRKKIIEQSNLNNPTPLIG